MRARGLGAVALGKWAFFVLLAIYAFEQVGASAVGLAVLVPMLPAGVTAPFTSWLADRRSRRDLLLVATLARALAFGLIAVAVGIGAPLALVLALAAACLLALVIQRRLPRDAPPPPR